ncbi:hypothetical protein EYZ11_009759 [Aspergillus tanneri]|nr:hypothetical protein EYZ11_009759 [Aspergillus tanneri]
MAMGGRLPFSKSANVFAYRRLPLTSELTTPEKDLNQMQVTPPVETAIPVKTPPVEDVLSVAKSSKGPEPIDRDYVFAPSDPISTESLSAISDGRLYAPKSSIEAKPEGVTKKALSKARAKKTMEESTQDPSSAGLRRSTRIHKQAARN